MSSRGSGPPCCCAVPGRDAGLPGPARGVQDKEARWTVGCRRERVWHAVADAHEAAFGDRGHLAVSVHEQHPGQDEEGLIGCGVDMQRRPGGGGGDSAGDDDGGASRRAGQDDFQFAAVTADGCALLRGDGGHVMALLPPDVHHGGARPAAISQPPANRSDGIRLRVLSARGPIRDSFRTRRRASATRFRRLHAPRKRGGGRGYRPPGAPRRWPATTPRSVYRGPAGPGCAASAPPRLPGGCGRPGCRAATGVSGRLVQDEHSLVVTSSPSRYWARCRSL